MVSEAAKNSDHGHFGYWLAPLRGSQSDWKVIPDQGGHSILTYPAEEAGQGKEKKDDLRLGTRRYDIAHSS